MRRYKNTYQQYQKRQNRHAHHKSACTRVMSVLAALVIFLSSFGYYIPIQASAGEEQNQGTDVTVTTDDGNDGEGNPSGTDEPDKSVTPDTPDSPSEETGENGEGKPSDGTPSGAGGSSESGAAVSSTGNKGSSDAGEGSDTPAGQTDSSKGTSGVDDGQETSGAGSDESKGDSDGTDEDEGKGKDASGTTGDGTSTDPANGGKTGEDASNGKDSGRNSSDGNNSGEGKDAEDLDKSGEKTNKGTTGTLEEKASKDGSDASEDGETDPDKIKDKDTDEDNKDADGNSEDGETVSSLKWGDNDLHVTAEGTFPAETQIKVSSTREDLTWEYTISYADENGDDVTPEEPAHVSFAWDSAAAPSATDDNGTTNDDNQEIHYTAQAYVNGSEHDASFEDGYKIAGLSFDTESGTASVKIAWTKTCKDLPKKEEKPTRLEREIDRTNSFGRNGKIKATVTAKEGVLPENASLEINPLSADSEDDKALYQEVTDQVKNQLAGDDQTLTGILLYNIFLDVNGEKTEPDGKVNLTVEWDSDDDEDYAATPTAIDDKKDGDWAKSSVSVLHVNQDKDSGDITSIDNLTKNAEDQKDKSEDDQNNIASVETKTVTADGSSESVPAVKKITIKVGSFSVFVLAWSKPTEKKEENSRKEISDITDDGMYKATYYYNDAAGVPDGAYLTIDELAENSDEYTAARAAVKESLGITAADGSDEDTLGFAALDITLHKSDGTEIEPMPQSSDDEKVVSRLKIEVLQMPEGMENGSAIQVEHLTKKEENTNILANAVRSIRRMVRRAPAVSAAPSYDVQKVLGEAIVNNGKASKEFSISGFSVFTVTWSINGDTKSRIGNVSMHYVNDSGMEIDRTTTFDSKDLEKNAGDIIKISDWVDDNSDGTRKVSGYRYVKATIGGFAGTEITAVKVQPVQTSSTSVSPTYKLYYTNAIDPETTSDWTLYQDSTSKNDSNNADIYLVFHLTAQSVEIHYVDEDGNILINPIYHYASETNNAGFNVKSADKSQNPWYEPVQNYEFTGRVHMGETGWQGFAFSQVRTQQYGDHNEDYRFQYTLGEQSDDWIDLTATDIYLIYKKTTNKKPVQVKYIDENGQTMKDEAGNSLDRIIDAADWEENVWQNLQGYSEDVDGYTIYARGIFVTTNGDSAYTNKIKKNDAHGSDANSNDLDNIETYGTVSGRPFNYLRYTGNLLQVGNGYSINDAGGGGQQDRSVKTAPEAKVNRYWTIDGDFTVYLVYRKNQGGKSHTYTLHYIDEEGNPLSYPVSRHNAEGQNVTSTQIMDDPVTITDGSSISITNISRTFDGYEKETFGFLGRPTVTSGGIPFTSISFSKSSDGFNWNYALENGESTSGQRQLNLSNIDIYVVYKKTTNTTGNGKSVTVHFVDTKGDELKNASGRAFLDDKNSETSTWTTGVTLNIDDYRNFSWKGVDLTASTWQRLNDKANEIEKAGYNFVGEYIGPDFNMDANNLVHSSRSESNKYIQWKYDSVNGWYTSHGSSQYQEHPTDGSDPTVVHDYVTDIYWVYTKQVKVHYVYIGKDNSLELITQDGLTNPDTSISISTDKEHPTDLSSGTYAPFIPGKAHIGTRLGPLWKDGLKGTDLGTNVVSAYKDNGKLVYSFDNASSAYTLEKQGNNDMWVYAAPSGRRFVLRKTSASENNYTIEDSQHGTFFLNLNGDNTYVATFHGEVETTEYTVTKTTDPAPEEGSISEAPSKDTYTLTIHDYIPDDESDIYEMYIDDDTSQAKVWIDDDLKYSGYFMVGRNQWIEDRMPGSAASGIDDSAKITSYYYSWEKIVSSNRDGSNPTTSAVERQQTGIHWNIAYNRTQRTWLDVEADNGGRNDSDQKNVKYRVTMHFKQGDAGEWQTVSSEPLSVDYYDQLMNGSFEDPLKFGDTAKGEHVVAADHNGDYSNKFYHDNGGVWQTTGLGSAGGKDGMDIEIVNIKNKNQVASDYRFANADAVTTADGGNQFAELNAETAGALYQDVITHPNEYLNYWLSHRARGINRDNNDAQTVSATTPEYDTMYLIIMPTKLAMTSAPDGGELTTQSDLEHFIQNHGGYDTRLATAVGQEVTYRDETNGILIEKISSNDQYWHNINVPNGYIAKAGLTRFFFAAGPTTADYRYAISQGKPDREPTQGNFIDAVGFSQQLPKAKGFNLVVSKTFSGLTEDQIGGLISNADASKNFKITLTDHARNTNTGSDLTDTDNAPNSALNGAVLSFTRNTAGSAVPFTATAVDKNGVNLIIGSNRGNVQENDDGSITITWTFINQAIDSSSNDQLFNYYAEESGTDVNGKSLGVAKTISPLEGSNDSAAVVQQGANAEFTFNNHYEDLRANDQPRIIVSKTFQGLTPSAVDGLFADGYRLTVSDGTKRYTLTTDDSTLDSNVSFIKSLDANSHNTTVRWTITGEGAGTYTVGELGYNSSDYKVTRITVNNEDVNDSSQKPPTDSMTKDEIKVGGESAATLTIGATSSGGRDDGETKNYDGPGESHPLPEGTNLIIAQFTIPSAQHNEYKYFVWTPEPVSTDVVQAIMNMINGNAGSPSVGWNAKEDFTQENSIFFRSGTNPGTLSTSYGSFSYDSTTRVLKFSSALESTATWVKYYSAFVKSGLDTPDISVVNSYNPVVKVQKVSDDNSTVLNGAEFKLFRSGTGANREYVRSDSTFDSNGQTFTTTNDGTLSLPSLSPGTYYLEETKAPEGYVKLSLPIAFTVNEDLSVSRAAKDAGLETIGGISADTQDPEWENLFYTIVVKNKAGYVLPETGGKGTIPFAAVGSALVLLAAGGWLWLRFWRKEELK